MHTLLIKITHDVFNAKFNALENLTDKHSIKISVLEDTTKTHSNQLSKLTS